MLLKVILYTVIVQLDLELYDTAHTEVDTAKKVHLHSNSFQV